MSPAKTAEPIEMPFGPDVHSGGPRKHALDGVRVRVRVRTLAPPGEYN